MSVLTNGEDLGCGNQSIRQCAAGPKGYSPVGVPTNPPWVDANCSGSPTGPTIQVQVRYPPKIYERIINRIRILNNEINYSWLNLILNSFNLKCKDLFLNKVQSIPVHWLWAKSLFNHKIRTWPWQSNFLQCNTIFTVEINASNII